MELGMRLFLGVMFGLMLSGVAWWIGSLIWVGFAILVSFVTFPVGFVIGFFWLEVKFALRFLIGAMFD